MERKRQFYEYLPVEKRDCAVQSAIRNWVCMGSRAIAYKWAHVADCGVCTVYSLMHGVCKYAFLGGECAHCIPHKVTYPYSCCGLIYTSVEYAYFLMMLQCCGWWSWGSRSHTILMLTPQSGRMSLVWGKGILTCIQYDPDFCRLQ